MEYDLHSVSSLLSKSPAYIYRNYHARNFRAPDGRKVVVKTSPRLRMEEIQLQKELAEARLALPVLFHGRVGDLPVLARKNLCLFGRGHLNEGTCYGCSDYRFMLMPWAAPPDKRIGDQTLIEFIRTMDRYLYRREVIWEPDPRHVKMYTFDSAVGPQYVAIDLENWYWKETDGS